MPSIHTLEADLRLTASKLARARRADRREELEVEARDLRVKLVRAIGEQHGWQRSPRPFPISALGCVRPRRGAPPVEAVFDAAAKRALGDGEPVYFRDAIGAPAGIIAHFAGILPEDDIITTALRFMVTASAVPGWGAAAKSRVVVYRRQ